MEFYFTNLCIIVIFNQVLNLCVYRIVSLILGAFEFIMSRAGYGVRYFLGTDRIASIPPSIEKRLVVQYQISIPKGLISSTSVRQ